MTATDSRQNNSSPPGLLQPGSIFILCALSWPKKPEATSGVWKVVLAGDPAATGPAAAREARLSGNTGTPRTVRTCDSRAGTPCRQSGPGRTVPPGRGSLLLVVIAVRESRDRASRPPERCQGAPGGSYGRSRRRGGVGLASSSCIASGENSFAGP